jgi:hypothetical protein
VGLFSHPEGFAKLGASAFSMFIQETPELASGYFSLYPLSSSITDIFRLESLLEPNSTVNSFSVLRCLLIPTGFDNLPVLVNVSDRQLPVSFVFSRFVRSTREQQFCPDFSPLICEFCFSAFVSAPEPSIIRSSDQNFCVGGSALSMFGRSDEPRHQFSDGEKAILRDLQMSYGDGPTPALLPPVRCLSPPS